VSIHQGTVISQLHIELNCSGISNSSDNVPISATVQNGSDNDALVREEQPILIKRCPLEVDISNMNCTGNV